MSLMRKMKAGDRLMIGKFVTIDCVKAGEGSLRLAISAPDGLPIHVVPAASRPDDIVTP